MAKFKLINTTDSDDENNLLYLTDEELNCLYDLVLTGNIEEKRVFAKIVREIKTIKKQNL
jgi:hypothetical protein